AAVQRVKEAFAGGLQLALDPERRIFVRHDAIGPARPVRPTVGRAAGKNLRRRLVLVAFADRARGLARTHRLGGEVGWAPRAFGRDDDPAADDRILAQLRHRASGPPASGAARGARLARPLAA